MLTRRAKCGRRHGKNTAPSCELIRRVLESIADAGTDNEWIERRLRLDDAAVDACGRVEEDLLYVEVGKPVTTDIVVDAGLDCGAHIVAEGDLLHHAAGGMRTVEK